MKILIIEDEEDLAKPLKRFLEKNSFSVEYASDGSAGLELASFNSYDCILLDLNLPKVDGIAVAEKLREEEIITPIIMITARSQMHNKLEGFTVGADDYVTKPFDLQELLARIKAVIKRNSVNKLESLTIGEYELLTQKNVIHNRTTNCEVVLSNKETAILEYLLRNKGKIISTEELLEHVWDSEVDFFTDTVKTHIKTLRKKVDPEKKLIQTVRGKGYLVKE